MTLHFNRFLTRKQVIEAYQIPTHLSEEVFAVLTPFTNSVEGPLYLESLVDRDLHRHFGNRVRPPVGQTGSSSEEDVMAMSWADTVGSVDDATRKPIEPLLVDETEAARLLGVSRRKVFELCEKGDLVSKLIGKRKLYSLARLRGYAEGRD
jgi:hypothetical protein